MQNVLQQPSFSHSPSRLETAQGTSGLLESRPGAAQRIGFTFVLLFLFFAFARVPEFLAERLGVVIPFAMIFSIIAGIAAVMSASVPRLAKMRPILWLITFTIWLGVAGIASSWHGGTLDMFKDYWSKSILICLVVAMLVVSLNNVRRAMVVLAYATLGVIVPVLLYSGTIVGRLVGEGKGSLSNPNELASRLLMGICFCLFVVSTQKGFSVSRVLMIVAIPIALVLALKTGSRSGLLTLVVLALMLFFRVSVNKKLLFLGGAGAMIILLLFVLPKDITERYATMFSGREDLMTSDMTDEQKIAVYSRLQRTGLIQEALTLTMEHPVFGVGPGVYAAAAATEATDQGRRANWHESHNTYLQLAAEDGIPGFVLYLFAIVGCVIGCSSVYRNARKYPALSEVSEMAFFLLLALVSWVVGAVFDSEAYRLEFPMLAALICAFSLAANAKIAQAAKAQSVTAMALGVPLGMGASSGMPGQATPVHAGMPAAMGSVQPSSIKKAIPTKWGD